MVRLPSHQINVPFIDSHSERLTWFTIIGLSTFFLFVYSTQVLLVLKEFPPNYFKEYTTGRDVQLPMGATLPKGAMENFHRVLLIYMPCIIIFFWILGPIIYGVKCTILEFRSMLPSAIQDHISRFIGAIERRVSFPFLPFPVAVLISTSKSFPKTSYRSDNVPLHRIWTASSVFDLEYLGHPLLLLCC